LHIENYHLIFLMSGAKTFCKGLGGAAPVLTLTMQPILQVLWSEARPNKRRPVSTWMMIHLGPSNEP